MLACPRYDWSTGGEGTHGNMSASISRLRKSRSTFFVCNDLYSVGTYDVRTQHVHTVEATSTLNQARRAPTPANNLNLNCSPAHAKGHRTVGSRRRVQDTDQFRSKHTCRLKSEVAARGRTVLVSFSFHSSRLAGSAFCQRQAARRPTKKLRI